MDEELVSQLMEELVTGLKYLERVLPLLRKLHSVGCEQDQVGNRQLIEPVRMEVEFVSRSDGRFELEDKQSHLASMCGSQFDMGPCAVVRHGGVTILLTSRKTPPFDLGQWRSQGIEPEKLFAIGVKAAVAHRRVYDRIARQHVTVDTPGPCSSRLDRFPWRRVRRPIFPLDP